MIVRLEGDSLHRLTLHAGDAVVGSETFIEQSPVGMEELAETAVVLKDLAEKTQRFHHHAFFQVLVVFGVKKFIGCEHPDLCNCSH